MQHIEFMWFLLSIGIIVLVISFAFAAQKIIDAEKALQQKCRDYLAQHGYAFTAYHPDTIGSPEECWGNKDGISVRVY